jgi:acyl-coenzyme A synthetase/AMP-(fatty) acid ligase
VAAYENIAQRILRVAEKHADETCIVIPLRDVTFGQLRGLVLSYAQHLGRRGVDRKSLVAIDLDNPVMRLASTLACTLLGAPWVDGTAAVVRERRLPYTHLLFGVDKPYEESLVQFRIDGSWAKPLSGPEAKLDPAGPTDTWMYSQSSGTTGTPKFMAIRHEQMDAFERLTPRVESDERQIIASLAPPGARGTPVMPLLFGGCAVVGGDFNLFLRAGVNRVAGSPVQFAHLLEGLRKPEKRIRVAEIVGAAAADTLLERMLDFFEGVMIRYGSSEMGIVAERLVVGIPVEPANVGPIVENAEVQIVDEDERVVPAGQEGIVRIRPRNVEEDLIPSGYVGSDEATKKVFRQGWFYPGDIGFFSEKAELHIVGRRDDRLNLGGVKVDAGRVDALIQNTPGVRDGYCFEDREDSGMSYLALLLLIEDKAEPDAIVKEIVRAMTASALFYRVHRAYVATEIPRTETGKPLRRLAPDFVRKQKPFRITLKEPGKA